MGRKRKRALRRAVKAQRAKRGRPIAATAEIAATQLRRMVRRATERIGRHFNKNPSGLTTDAILAALGKEDARTLRNFLFAGEALVTARPLPAPTVAEPVTPAVAPPSPEVAPAQ